MGLQGYVGGAEDVRRIRRQEKQREEEKKKFEEKRKRSDANVDAAGLKTFGAGKLEVIEAAFKNETVGLVTREEFLNKRNTLQARQDEEVARQKRAAEAALQQEKEERQRKKARLAARSKLSFAGEEEDEAVGEDGDGGASAAGRSGGAVASSSAAVGAAAAAARGHRLGKLGKDPAVPTDFLPDADREREEEQLREQLKREYELRQQLLKNEALKVTYSYWDGTGHRRQTAVRKGDTIGAFLAKVREQLSPEFRDLRGTSISSLMYVKEDLIIPHMVSFYDLIVQKARGKSGPLFHFDVHEDVRMQSDATVEKDESHAGKVVDRHWYNKNKHIFPASRWEVYEPEKQFDSYSIYG
ncbi:hypothetical protein WJX81_008314 [Elliptochloris bilobata]|uniref:FAM50A/XAP5 C-terminal domain-containing protein n=1 Tax=Elliptochloris bilobata TaxID=381761 RepID=A0AAW1RJQ2_9CHLO